jgi:transcriptional antiterminator
VAVELDAGLRTRLSLLQQSGQVDADVAEFMGDAVGELCRTLGRPLTDEAAGALVTHTALALQRARAGQSVTEWEVDHSEELAAYPRALAAAAAFVQRAGDQLGLRLPEQEEQFMALHLAAIEDEAS